jgi:predicted metalloprotease with PDZ domain
LEPPAAAVEAVTSVRYRISIPEPHTHLVRVELHLRAVAGAVELVMPSWTPGSYLLREFARNVQEFRAEDADGDPLVWEKTDKNSWRVAAPAGGELRVAYTVYANELTVRTSHVDASHAYLNGASVFMYVRGREAEPAEVEVLPPPGWGVTTPLSAVAPQEAGRGPVRLRAESYHQMVDSPTEIGEHTVLEFEEVARPHRYAVWGRGGYDARRLVGDTKRIIRTTAAFWGAVPYDAYTFFLHLVPGGRGGLEHRDSCSLHADPFAFSGSEYEQFLALVAHEFFHTWNGTRIRPAPLAELDYTRENYTRNLWVIEGLTTYYTDIILCRAGIITADRYLERLGEAIQRHETLPGRHVQSLADSSFDTWIKFYRPSEHTPNSQVSYYQKGALVGLLLDMRIRRRTGGRRSLDDVMRLLWTRYGAPDVGFPEATAEGFQAVAEEVCGEPLDDFFAAYLFGLDELPLDDALEVVGLRLDRSPAERRPGGGTAAPPAVAEPAPISATGGAAATSDAVLRFGIRVEERGGRPVVAYVRHGSPAHRSGVNAGDELVALEARLLDTRTLGPRLGAAARDERCRLSVLRRGQLVDLEVETRGDPVGLCRVRRAPTPSAAQEAALQSWLGG